jgi:hypothetical protein
VLLTVVLMRNGNVFVDYHLMKQMLLHGYEFFSHPFFVHVFPIVIMKWGWRCWKQETVWLRQRSYTCVFLVAEVMVRLKDES